MKHTLEGAMQRCADVMGLPADIAARRAELIVELDNAFPLDERAWLDNLDVALPLLREAVREALGVRRVRLTADERSWLNEALVEVLDEAGLDMPLSENEILELTLADDTVNSGGRRWLHGACPSRVIALVAVRTCDPSLIPVWRETVEWEEWRAEDARRRLYGEYEDEDDYAR